MKSLKIASLLLFVFCIFSCRKKTIIPERLPDAHNSNDRKVFGCLVNGEVWLPKGKGILSPTQYTYLPSRDDFHVIAERFEQEPSGSIMFHSEFKEVGKHKIYAAFYKGFGCDYESINIDTNNPSNFVEIDSFEKVGPANYLLIGRFQFTAIDSVCQDTVKVTDGRFKVTTP